MTIGVLININNKLMSQDRDLDYLNRHRIIYKRDPVNDAPSEETKHYRFYENGTYECYHLFKSKAKINTYKSLKWHLLVIRYLNKDIDYKQFREVAIHVSEKSNGFTTFVISERRLVEIIDSLKEVNIDEPPKNRIRKIIFKDNCGQILGRSKRASDSDIYEAMLCLHEDGNKITVNTLAKYLGVSTRTIFRNITDALRTEKQKLNNETLQRTELHPLQKRTNRKII